jgi:hypothetical protein
MLLGVAVTLVLGVVMFYAGQWGGADSKIIIGLGALLGLGFGTLETLLFIVLMLLGGAVYGIVYALTLAVGNWRSCATRFKQLIRQSGIHAARRIVVIVCFLLFATLVFLPGYRSMLFLVLVGIYVLFYLWLLIKTVEEAVLIKEYPVGKLTEGDWIYKDVTVRGKLECGPKDLGISKEQIARLKMLKVQRVWVKEGIPFLPSFLLAYILLWFLNDYVAAALAAVLNGFL